MGRLSAEQIVTQRQARGTTLAEQSFSSADLTRPFIPENYTQLYHTVEYRELNDKQRLRYNQLYGARTNEQFMLFESGFTNRIMQNMLHLKYLGKEPVLAKCLTILLEEEKNHYRMFRALNKKCLPEIYQNNQYYFLKLSFMEQVLLGFFCRYPQQLVSLLWLILLMEEHAVRFSKDLIENQKTENLGPLEHNFILAHQAHLQDEAGHVHIDANLIDFVLERSSQRKKTINVMLLKKLIKTTLRPRHAGINVLRRLAVEFPELNPVLPKLIGAVRRLNYDPCILPILEDRTQTPLTATLLNLYPEFEQALDIQ